eukprot:TRINITY_DN96005_c0_g1_i1.p1 TRINITY_DN96005_c0_g1~~TRINITY_DN96005_c0_g1_i1.p1  ORF type:complete len:389 (+),score=86.65 TRINITY_DN96005_c0_g1_i1:993-2159(+)
MDAEDEILSGSEAEQEEEKDCTDSDTCAKYKTTARIVNDSLAALLKELQPGKRVSELCDLGDSLISKALEPLYSKGKGEDRVLKGLAFPTCISVNEVVCHNNPGDEATDYVLANGDIVRIDIGGHIDGYSVATAHTAIVQAEAQPITGKAADVIAAAQTCLAVALRSLRPGEKNHTITELWEKVAAAYDVNVAEGILSHRTRRFVPDSNAVIISKQTPEQKVDEEEFEVGQVWAIDVVISSGPGKFRAGEARPTIFKRQPDTQYLLKMKASRDTMKEIQRRFMDFPFALRQLSDQKTARMGIVECMKHDLLVAYPALVEKAGEFVAHFKASVLITKNEIAQVTGLPVAQPVESDKKIEDPVLQDVLKRSLRLVSKTAKKKAKATKAEA